MDLDTPLRDIYLKHAKSGSIISQIRATLGALPIVLKSLMDKSDKNIQVVLSSTATTGATDCTSKVILPRVPLPSDNDDVDSYVEIAAFLYGLIHHEVGHINDSTPGMLNQCSSQLAASITNIIEDVRQENLHIRRYPGARRHLNALMMAGTKRGMFGYVSPNEQPSSIFMNYLLYRFRAEFRNDPVSTEFYPSAKKAMDQVFPAGMTTRIEPLIGQFNLVASSEDAFDLAERLVQFLVQEQQDQQQQQQQQQQQGDQQGSQTGQGNNDPSTQPDSSDGDSTQDSSNNGAPQSGDSAGDTSTSSQDQDGNNDPGQSSQSTDGQSSDDASSGNGAGGHDPLKDLLDGKGLDDVATDLHKAARKLLDDALGETRAAESIDPTAVEHMGDIEQSMTEPQLGGSYDMGEAVNTSARLRRTMLSKLDALTNAEHSTSAKGRRLSNRHLHRVISGDPRVFRHVAEGKDVDTAVMLLEDVSGSMSGTRIHMASEALYATALALHNIEGIDLGVMTFPGNSQVLRFGENPKRMAHKFQLSSWGGTPMASCITLATRILNDSRRARKLMIVLTDGQPDNVTATATAIAVAESMDIELYGVGIQTPQVKNLFDRWVTINAINELPGRLSSMVSDRILGSLEVA